MKGTDLELHDAVHVKRKIISTILNGMSVHRNDETMMRNGCLTLCQFKIPLDVVSIIEIQGVVILKINRCFSFLSMNG